TLGLLLVTFTVAACGPNDNPINPGRDMAVTHPSGGDGKDMAGPPIQPVRDLAGTIPPDMTFVDPIQAVQNPPHNANPDAGALDLPLSDVVVTYLHPLIGTDPAGFFVQEHAGGPAVFIAVDPATLAPAPVVGDRVSFTVTGVTKIGGLHAVNAL